ncbi:MAG: hypothetical protein EOP45_01260 [Sphingobacteriaceae bacterium]|nr:MAG: hypothetical protein EOP45_01260 [Sphingobacteriaceae bacterium]
MDNNLEEDDALELIFRRIKELEDKIATSRAIIDLTQILVLELKTEFKSLREELKQQQINNNKE